MIYETSCGYCGGDSAMMEGYSVDEEFMTAQNYQKLMDSGFRRSGRIVYRPVYSETCCPLQSIRLDADEFAMSKSQRNCLIKFLKEIGIEGDWSKKNREELMALVHDLLKAKGSERFSYTWDPASLDAEEAFQVWRRYQIAIHNDSEDELTLSHFKQSFVKSPLKQTLQAQLRLDGKLIGVGVLDVAKSCLSSVYFYYDPDYKHLNLGTVSCLFEITLCQLLCDSGTIDAPFYYLGYYLSTCKKLLYKATFKPFELLNQETFIWEPSA